MAYSPTWRSGRYSRHTSLTTPPKSTVAIRVPSRSSMSSTLPGTARHMGPLLVVGRAAQSRGESARVRATIELAERQAPVVGRDQAVPQDGEAVLAAGRAHRPRTAGCWRRRRRSGRRSSSPCALAGRARRSRRTRSATAVWKRAAISAGAAPARRSATTAASTGAGSATSGARRRPPARPQREGVAGRRPSAPARAGPRPPARRRPAPRIRRGGTPRRGRRRRRRAGPCWRWARS